MSLLIWLPLHGNLINYGLANHKFELVNNAGTALSVGASGKTGSSCYQRTKVNTADYITSKTNLKLEDDFTMACWCKVTQVSGADSANGILTNHNHATNSGSGITLKEVGTSACYISCNTGNGSNRTYNTYYGTTNLLGAWHHLCVTYQKATTAYNLYVDGVCEKTFTYGNSAQSNPVRIFDWSTGYSTNSAYRPNCLLNDVRIYDHCLSPREIQYIATGLIAHYPLKDGGVESTTNLAPYPTPGTAISPGWDTTLHPGAISVSGWTNGYNSGVSTAGTKNPEIGYHAHWKVIDGIPTIVFPDINNGLSLGHRWLGVCTGGMQTKIGPSTTYTISFDAKSNVEGKQISSGYYYRVSGASSNNFHDGDISIVLTTSWKRYSLTFTTLSTLDTSISAAVYIYGHKGSLYGISYVKNIQIELKDHATPYTPTSRQATIEDCSGYARHGEIIGNIATNYDAVRYNQCIYHTDGRSNYIKTKAFTMPTDAVTMSCWFKSNTTGYNSYQIPLSFNSANYELSIDPSGHFRNGFTINGSRQVLTTSHTSILDNKWHMITATYDGKTIRRYLDGKELTSYATSVSGTLVGGNSNLYIGTYNSGGYANKNAYMSDVRVYASALSAAAIETLYKSRIAFTEQKDVMAYEFIEDGAEHLKMTEKGLIRTGGVSETMTAFNMPIKTLDDGSAWARIHWLDVTSNKSWFANAAEVQECLNQSNRYSRMNQVENFINSEGYYEFMLTYPRLSATGYNRWKQTSSPNASTVTGLEKIHTSWDDHNGGIRKHGSACLYNCDTGSTWFAPIGQYTQWTTGKYIPGADGNSQTETELWVRIDTLPSEKRISLFDDKYIQALHIYEI